MNVSATSSPSGARAAFFDMDRTLVRVNTAPLWMRWQYRRGEARRRDLARVAWWVLRYSLGAIDARSVAGSAARTLAGIDEPTFRSSVAQWVQNEVLPLVSGPALDEISRRRRDGYVPVLLTSSTPYAAEPVAFHAGIEHVLASGLEVIDGKFSGRLTEPFCYGGGKVTAATEWCARNACDLASSVFFTDSISDLPMLEAVGEPVVVNPDPRLWLVARRKGWRVERW